MNEIMINGQALAVKEYEGKRVITLREIDKVHERPDGTAKRNFHSNKKRFIEGEDFFKITPYEFRTAIGEMDERQQNDIILITESGYLMITKSFKDDLAWQIHRELVNNYFKVREEMPRMTPMEMIAGIAKGCVELEKRQNDLEQRMSAFERDREETIKATLAFGRISFAQQKEISKAVRKRAIELCKYAEAYDIVGSRVVNAIYKAVQRYFDIPSYKDLCFNQLTEAFAYISAFEPEAKLMYAITQSWPKPSLGLLNKLTGNE